MNRPRPNKSYKNSDDEADGWTASSTTQIFITAILGTLLAHWLLVQGTVLYTNRVPLMLNNRRTTQVPVYTRYRRDVYAVMANPGLQQQMTGDGRLFLVGEGTHVRWLTSEGDCAEVRITAGPDKGREGWVYDQWVVPQ